MPRQPSSRPRPLVPLPRGWRTETPEAGVLLRARPPVAGPSGVMPEVTLTVRPVSGPDAEWVDDEVHDLAARLELFALEDEDAWASDAGEVHYRRFAHRRGRHDLLVERWCWAAGGRGHVLEAGCDREDYEEFCDVFEELARAARSATACGSVRAS